jgi:cyclopropane fatty-acyl-phospholipid synthase-like methyltransferase
MDSYDEMSYWNSRKEPTSGKSLNNIAYLSHRLRQAQTVLDFGPGAGGTLCAYSDAKFVCAVDISTLYEKRLRKEAAKYPFSFATYFLTNVAEALVLPFDTGAYDFAVVCQVLMHMKPHYVGRSCWNWRELQKRLQSLR